jgi:hypothetical protein
MSFVILLSLVTPSFAQGGKQAEIISLLEKQDQRMNDILDKEQIELYGSLVEELIVNDGISYFSENKNLDYENSRLVNIDNGVAKAFTIPIRSDEVRHHEMSNFTIFFDEQNNVFSTTELLLTETKQGTFKINFFVDGKNEVSEITEYEFLTSEEYLEGQKGNILPMVDWDGFILCIGINTAVLQPIIAFCAASCAIPAVGPAICAACLGAQIGIPAGSLISCLISNW